MQTMDWLTWQLADSAFPTGGFAHSGGLEAAWQLGLVVGDSLERFVLQALDHGCSAALPIVAAAHADPGRFDELDELAGAALSNHVAHRASRAQGAALIATAAAAFGAPGIVDLRARARRETLPLHLAPCFGFVTRALEVPSAGAVRLFSFLALRTLLSSAVRLGAIGPLEAQAIQHRISPRAEEIAGRHARRPPEELAQTHPLLELFQAQHDRLYSRLFSS